MTCKAISNVCSNFFSPLKPISTCCPCGSTAIKVGAYFTVVLPLLFAVTWGGAKLCDYLFTAVPIETQLKKQNFDEFMASTTAKACLFVLDENIPLFALNGNVQVLISFDPNAATLGKIRVVSRKSMEHPTIKNLGSYLVAKYGETSFYRLEGSVQLTDLEDVEYFS